MLRSPIRRGGGAPRGSAAGWVLPGCGGSARSQAAAIAPATGSPAGVRLLVGSMDERLAAMQREIDTTKAQNRLLATRLRQVAAAYRTTASRTPMGGPHVDGRAGFVPALGELVRCTDGA